MVTRIYLDHAATTPPDSAALEAYISAARLTWENPSSVYSAGTQAKRQLQQAHRTLSQMIGADPNQLIFTSGGTESNALALYQAAGRHVVLSAIEHASVLEAAEHFGCRITLVQPDENGVIMPEAIAGAITSETALISVQAANNETGVIQPIRQIGALAREKKVLFHCDAVQAFGKIPLDVRDCRIDMLSASSHKIYGPKGSGFLYIGDRVRAKPLIPGSQQFGLRGGTEDLPAAVGFAAAAELCREQMGVRSEREAALRDLCQSLLSQDGRIRFPGEKAPRLPGILSVILPGIPSERAIARLDRAGIQVSGGAACASASQNPSHVLRAMGIPEDQARCAIRISLGKDTTEEDIVRAAHAILALYE